MASSGRLFPDPEDLLSRQIVQALAFVNWAKDEVKRLQNDGVKARLLYELASDCYAIALRDMSEHLLDRHVPPDKSRRS